VTGEVALMLRGLNQSREIEAPAKQKNFLENPDSFSKALRHVVENGWLTAL
jgi:hypothetical protein